MIDFIKFRILGMCEHEFEFQRKITMYGDGWGNNNDSVHGFKEVYICKNCLKVIQLRY